MLGWVPRVVLPGKTADVEIRESGLEPQRLSDPPARAGRGGQSLGGCAANRHRPGMDAGPGSSPCLKLVEPLIHRSVKGDRAGPLETQCQPLPCS